MQHEPKDKSRADELASLKIKTIEEGKELVSEIEQHMNDIMLKMREDGISNELHEQYTDLHYDFKSARHSIQKQLGSLVKRRMKDMSN